MKKTSISELMDIVAAGDDLAAEDAATLCKELSPGLWAKALERRRKAEEREAAEDGDI